MDHRRGGPPCFPLVAAAVVLSCSPHSASAPPTTTTKYLDEPESHLSFDEAVDRATTGPQPRDDDALTEDQLAVPLAGRPWIEACSISSWTTVSLRVAIQRTRAIGVTVRAHPPSLTLEECVAEWVRGRRWPYSQTLGTLEIR